MVSDAFTFANDARHAFIQETLDLIDGIHEDGALEHYEIRLEVIFSESGRELEGRTDPVEHVVTINPLGLTKRVTLLHEIGHVLDFSLGI